MTKLPYLMLLFVILISSLGLALSAGGGNVYIWAKGDTGIDDSDDFSHRLTGYSLNYPTQLQNYTNTSYSICSLGASDFAPIVVDFNKDGYGEILTGAGTQYTLYNRDCSPLTSFSVFNAPRGAPVMDNPDSDTQMNIYIGNNSHLWDYEYNPASGEFDYLASSNKSNLGASHYVCPWLTNYCYGVVSSVGGYFTMQKYNMITHSTDGYAQAGSGLNGASYVDKRIGYHFSKVNVIGGSAIYRIITPWVDDTGNDLYISLWNGQTGAYITTALLNNFAGTTANIKHLDSFIAQLGTANYVFTSYDINTTFGYNGVFISDSTNLNTLYSDYNSTAASTAGNWISNWAVGDFNHDGSNDACYLTWRDYDGPGKTGYNHSSFVCLASAGGEPTEIDVTGDITINNIVMGDFISYADSGRNYSEIATCEGIFEYNGVSFDKIFDTGISGTCAGELEVYLDGSSGVPMFFYTDSTRGIVVKASAVGAYCGNNVCDLYENPYNCLEDCPINATGAGTLGVGVFVDSQNASLCLSGYIAGGKCSLRPASFPCDLNSQCLSDSCINDKCTTPTWIESIGAIKDDWGASDIGSSTLLSLIVSLFCMGGVALLLGKFINGIVPALAGLLVFILVFSFLGIIGWVSPFLLIGMWFLIALAALGLILLGRGG